MILTNQPLPKFDENPDLEALDRAQPLHVCKEWDFIVLTQWDWSGSDQRRIRVECADLPTLIAALEELR